MVFKLGNVCWMYIFYNHTSIFITPPSDIQVLVWFGFSADGRTQGLCMLGKHSVSEPHADHWSFWESLTMSSRMALNLLYLGAVLKLMTSLPAVSPVLWLWMCTTTPLFMMFFNNIYSCNWEKHHLQKFSCSYRQCWFSLKISFCVPVLSSGEYYSFHFYSQSIHFRVINLVYACFTLLFFIMGDFK